MAAHDEKNYAELERIEDKYIINLSDFDAIKAEIEKNMQPAYPDKKTKYVLISTTYLDSPSLDFFKHHVYAMKERTKVRIRKYGPDGDWDNVNVFLEIKEKIHEDIKKYRIQLDESNLDNVKNGKGINFNSELEELNKPLYTHTDLKRFIDKYNKLSFKNELTPILTVKYKRLAYGKGPLRVTMDTNISYKKERVLSLSNALKIKKSINWKDAKEYKNKYDPSNKAVLEIKHNSSKLPVWLQNILDANKMEPEKFSKYVYSVANIINDTVGE